MDAPDAKPQPPPVPNAPTGPRQFPCKHCGAMLEFEPGTRALKCQYCGTLNEIALSDSQIQELDYQQHLLQLESSQETVEALVVHCTGCGAESTLPEGKTAGDCAFCGRAVVAQAVARRLIKPRSLLPFAIKDGDAKQRFGTWLGSLWFAPSGLKKYADAGGLKGVYLPAWTYDADATSDYTGQRGEHYWDTEWYTTTEGGKTVRKSRRVRKTRWYAASGRVFNHFDDVLVLADRSLPDDLRRKLTGWDLPQLVPYDDAFLSGFVAEAYQLDLPGGFTQAQEVMAVEIRSTVESDIGGDEQRIHSLDSVYSAITFKHILLPVWISAYRFKDRTYHFVINARTGQVCGQRPWSAWKIALLVITILLVILTGVIIANAR